MNFIMILGLNKNSHNGFCAARSYINSTIIRIYFFNCMRQHVNPLSSNFNQIEKIPSLSEMFADSKSNLHLDIGCAAGDFLFDLALVNTSWNYLGIEIREKLVKNAKLKVFERDIKNLYFVFGNANNILNDVQNKFIIKNLKSLSFNFPDPWFKKKHYKRRVIQPDFINILSNILQKGSLIFIRPSGTEPLIRVLVEAESEKRVNSLSREITNKLSLGINKILNKL